MQYILNRKMIMQTTKEYQQLQSFSLYTKRINTWINIQHRLNGQHIHLQQTQIL